MANLCYTNMKLIDTEDKLQKLDNLLDLFTSSNATENGYGHDWLGNIVLNGNLGSIDSNDENFLRCRGSLLSTYIEDGALFVTTETAWSPCLQMFLKLLEKYSPTTELLYITEEFGCDICCTNDPEYEDKYYLDSWGDIEPECCLTEKELVNILQYYLATDESNLDTLLDLLDEVDEAELAVHKWEYVPVEEWD